MVRTVIYLLAGIFLISVVRMIIGVVGRAFTEATMGPAAAAKQAPKDGELKKCVVCGTYAPVATAPKVDGVPVFLCSEGCAQKYRA